MNNIDETIQGTNQQASSENAISPEAPTETSQTESREEPTHSPDTIEPSDEPVDEYGNDVSSSNEKKFTNRDVERIVQERLKRAKQSQFEPDQSYTDAAQHNQHEQNSSDDIGWEEQLEAVIDTVIAKKQSQYQEKQQQEFYKAEQAKFEQKFSADMAKYDNFEEVISPIANKVTPYMMQGIQHLDNPAGFLYSVAQKHPDELNKISQMANPYQQIAAMSALEASLRQPKKTGSNAPRPMGIDKGDVNGGTKSHPRLNNIDYIIMQQEKARRERR